MVNGISITIECFGILCVCVSVCVCVCVCVCMYVCCAQSCLTLCYPVSCSQSASLVHGFSRQGNWSGVPPSPGNVPDSGIKLKSSGLQADSLPSKPPRKSLWVYNTGFPHSSVGKESACNTGGPSSIPGLGRSPGEGNGNPLQYSCLENPMAGGAW